MNKINRGIPCAICREFRITQIKGKFCKKCHKAFNALQLSNLPNGYSLKVVREILKKGR